MGTRTFPDIPTVAEGSIGRMSDSAHSPPSQAIVMNTEIGSSLPKYDLNSREQVVGHIDDEELWNKARRGICDDSVKTVTKATWMKKVRG